MKKKTFGRAAALGLAGLTALPAFSIVASAEAYPTYVYEFTYGGIEKTQIYYSAISAMSDNDYVKFTNQTEAQAVFAPATGFKVSELTDFWTKIDTAYNASKGANYACTNKPAAADSWQYAQASAFTSDVTPVVPEESYKERAGSTTLKRTFAFKTQAERDAAMNDIVAKNKNEYTKKYNAANAALAKDLSAAISAYQTAQRDIISKVQAEVNKRFKEENANGNNAPYVSDVATLGITLTSLDSSVDGEVWQKEGTPATSTQTLSEWVSKQNAYVSAQVKELNAIATQIKKEFAEAYKPANWAFAYDSASDGFATTDAAVPFVSTYGAVSLKSTGSYISTGATYKTVTEGSDVDLDLQKDFYRTVGAYVSPESYAFKGEILPNTDRTSDVSAEIASLLLDSDCWSLFSVLTEGSPSDNSNTTEGGTTTTDKEEETTTPTPDQTAIYKVGDKYYYTYSSALSAAGGNEKSVLFVSDYVTPGNYFSSVTGGFYSTYNDALAASGNNTSNVITINGTASNENANTYDPYYYYFMNKNNASTSTSKDTSTVTAGNVKGWTALTKAIKNVKSGKSVTVKMNDETVVPSTFLAAIDGKNVTTKLTLDNGVVYTVNGKDIASTKNVNIETEYNTKNVPSKLVKAAYKKNDAISTAQISIDAGSFGFEADVTIKFNKKRAGDKAKLYRYNESKNSLQLVDTATIGSNGKTTFDGVTKGGDFVIVVC